MKGKIVLIESDRQSERLIRRLLSPYYEVFSAVDFADGYSLASSETPDLVIIDPLYPKHDGIKLIKSLREWSDCQIIAVSSNGTERAAVEIMESGADDFIRKPFFSKELAVRVERCFRNIQLLAAAKGTALSGVYNADGLTVDYDTGEVTVENKKIRLTKSEFKILSLLCKNSGKVLTYDYILKKIWGPSSQGGNGILRVNVANLRKKLERPGDKFAYVITENGVGYKVNADGSSPLSNK